MKTFFTSNSIILSVITAFTYSNALDDNTPAVACCHQHGGTYLLHAQALTGTVDICALNGQNYQAPFFLQEFCNGAPFQVEYQNCALSNQRGFANTCLSCCVRQFRDFDAQCGEDQNCDTDNLNGVTECQNSCADQCVEYCFQDDSQCVTRCSETIEDANRRRDCVQTCSEQYQTCTNNCGNLREESASSMLP